MNNVNVTGWIETDLSVDDKTRQLVASYKSKVNQLEQDIKQLEKAAEDQKKNTKPTAAASLPGIIIDNTEAETTGPWRKSTYRPNRVGDHYFATDKGKGPFSITWKAKLPKPGKYEVRVSFGGGSGLEKKAPYTITHAEGKTPLVINQTVTPTIRGLWFPLGQFNFETEAEIHLSDKNTSSPVIADAVQLVHVDDIEKEAKTPDINQMKAELKKLKSKAPKVPKAMAAADHSDRRFGDLHIRIRGETGNLGHKVPRGFLQVASYTNQPTLTIPENQSGRVQLAEWLTHPDHPLTARVMVNRIWQQLFGRGIVATSDNFGVLGSAPSHPELLDYLAESFVASNWSTKSLIKEIMTSDSYLQAVSTASDDDPDNIRLRHQNRRPAPAETIRDSILAIAGELDAGRQKSAVTKLGMYAIETNGRRHESLSRLEELRQRSIYLPIVRGALPPSLTIFDLPNPDLVTGTRAVTTVPSQALFMMNSPLVQEMSKSVATRVTANEPDDEKVIKELYLQILIREADSGDLAMAKEYIESLLESGKSRHEAIASLVQVLFSSTEFRFVE